PFCFLALRKGTGAKPVREYRRVRRGGGGLARRPRHLPARKKGGAIGRRWDERGLPPKHPRTDDHPLRTSVPRPPRSAAVQTHLGSDEGSATRPARSALATRQLGPACSLNVIASPARRPPLRMWSTRPLAPTHPGRVPWGSGTRTSTPPAWAGGEVDEGHQLRRRHSGAEVEEQAESTLASEAGELGQRQLSKSAPASRAAPERSCVRAWRRGGPPKAKYRGLSTSLGPPLRAEERPPSLEECFCIFESQLRYHPPLKAKRPPLWRRARC
ncbi:unnamed protein product, partial [Prorocentrum cordatum]